MKNRKLLSIFLILVGLIGLGTTGYFIVNSYVKAKNISELLKPVTIGFIPFFLSFAVTRIGISNLASKNK